MSIDLSQLKNNLEYELQWVYNKYLYSSYDSDDDINPIFPFDDINIDDIIEHTEYYMLIRGAKQLGISADAIIYDSGHPNLSEVINRFSCHKCWSSKIIYDHAHNLKYLRVAYDPSSHDKRD